MKTGRFRWWMVWLLIGPITFVMSLDRTAIVVAAPVIQKEYGFSLVDMSLILTSFSWTYAFLQVPAGWLAERAGPRRALYWANLLWSFLTALTPAGFSLGSFIAIRAALGVGQAADWPASVLALRRWFPKRERAKGNSVLLGGLYPGSNHRRTDHHGGHAELRLAVRVLWLRHPWAAARVRMVVRISRQPGGASLGLCRGSGADRRGTRTGGAGHAEGGVAGAVRSVQFWAIGLEYFFLILIQSFYTSWLPTYLVQARNFSLKSMGIYASLPWVALFCMVFIAGGLADRLLRATGSVWKARVPAAITGFVVSAAGLILAAETANVALMMAFLCISLGAIGLTQVSIWSSCQDLGGAATGVVTGWTNFLGNSSGFVGPVVIALLVKWTGGWSGALLGIALAGLCGAVLWLFVHPERQLQLPQDLTAPVVSTA